MPLLEKTAGLTGGPSKGAHTDAAAAFVPDQSRAERPTSFDVAAFPIPTGREEDWRFTPVDRLRSLLTDSPTEDGAVEYAVTAPDGVRIGTLGRGQAPRGTALVPADRAAVVADANSPQATHVKIPPEAELEEPVRVVVTGKPGARSNGHVVVEAGHHSKAVVVLDHEGGGEHTGNVEVVVGDGANLTVVSIQHWDDEAHHLGQHDAPEAGRVRLARPAMITRTTSPSSSPDPAQSLSGTN